MIPSLKNIFTKCFNNVTNFPKTLKRAPKSLQNAFKIFKNPDFYLTPVWAGSLKTLGKRSFFMGTECWGPGGKCAKLLAEVIFRKCQQIFKILTTARVEIHRTGAASLKDYNRDVQKKAFFRKSWNCHNFWFTERIFKFRPKKWSSWVAFAISDV